MMIFLKVFIVLFFVLQPFILKYQKGNQQVFFFYLICKTWYGEKMLYHYFLGYYEVYFFTFFLDN